MFYELSHIGSVDYFKKLYCKNLSFPPHIHNCFELAVCLSGEMQISVDETVHILKKGEAVLIFPHQLHSFSSDESKNMICIFSQKLVSEYYKSHAALKPISNKFIPYKDFILALDNYKDNYRHLFIKGLLYLICDSFDSKAEYIQHTNKSLLEKIFLFVNENFTCDCSLNAVASNMGYNASYISRYFKKCVGINLCDYVNIVRLGNVCYLYENSDGTILTFALDSGYDSLRTFNRNFKKFYGVSPREYFESGKISKKTNAVKAT